MPGQRVDDLKTVVTEACNNVVVHAYDGDAGPLEVTAISATRRSRSRSATSGRGFQPRASESAEPSLGLGLPLIASLSDSFEIRGGAGEGTSDQGRASRCAALDGRASAAAEPERARRGAGDGDQPPARWSARCSPG